MGVRSSPDLTITNTHNMKKYILRERLADFIEKAWDAGVRIELDPENSAITVNSPSYYAERLEVLDGSKYDDMVSSVIAAAKDDAQSDKL